CSASGKIFLAQMSREKRRRLLAHAPLERCTPNTITDIDRLEREVRRVERDGVAIDDEEFLPGLVCVAVLVPPPAGAASNLCVALQAPASRISAAGAKKLLPVLQRAAAA